MTNVSFERIRLHNLCEQTLNKFKNFAYSSSSLYPVPLVEEAMKFRTKIIDLKDPNFEMNDQSLREIERERKEIERGIEDFSYYYDLVIENINGMNDYDKQEMFFALTKMNFKVVEEIIDKNSSTQ